MVGSEAGIASFDSSGLFVKSRLNLIGEGGE